MHLLKIAVFFAALAGTFCWAKTSRAQDAGAAHTFERKASPPKAYAYNEADGSLFTIEAGQSGKKKGDVFLAKYDKQLRRQWRKVILNYNKDTRIEDLKCLNGSLIFFHSVYEQKTSKSDVFFRVFDFDGAPKTEQQLFYTTEERNDEYDILAYRLAGGQIMVYDYDATAEPEALLSLRYFLFTGQTTAPSQKELVFPYKYEAIYMKRASLSETGDWYVLAKILLDKKGRELSQRRFVLMKYNLQSERFVEIPLPFDSIFMKEIGITATSDGALLGGGLYSRTNTGVAGTFYFRYDGTGNELASFRAVDFDRELKARYLDKHDLKKNKELPCSAYERYQLRYIKARPGAGAILMFERKLITVTETRDANGLIDLLNKHYLTFG